MHAVVPHTLTSNWFLFLSSARQFMQANSGHSVSPTMIWPFNSCQSA
uniref:Uncharacterized protein n=1 Tax=Kalanchoe fedtschenkoi TaxID=63787 RepID=A0A7N0UZL4_KALFE